LSTWRLQHAKAQFSKVFELALKGEPQIVARRRKEAVVVLERTQYESLLRPLESLASFLLRSPFRGSQLDIPHSRERYVSRVNFENEND
jgi:hypothetical protein